MQLTEVPPPPPTASPPPPPPPLASHYGSPPEETPRSLLSFLFSQHDKSARCSYCLPGNFCTLAGKASTFTCWEENPHGHACLRVFQRSETIPTLPLCHVSFTINPEDPAASNVETHTPSVRPVLRKRESGSENPETVGGAAAHLRPPPPPSCRSGATFLSDSVSLVCLCDSAEQRKTIIIRLQKVELTAIIVSRGPIITSPFLLVQRAAVSRVQPRRH